MEKDLSPEFVRNEVLATYPRFDLSRFDYPETDEWVLWGATMRLLGRLVEVVKPRRVIEFGSGRSTVVLAAVAHEHGGKVLSFDHNARFARQTAEALKAHGLEETACVAHRRLTLRRYGFKLLPFYALRWAEFPDFEQCEVALIDGPPGWIGREATIYELFPQLAPGAWVVVDDTNRRRDQRWLNAWQRMFGDSLEVQVFPEIGEGVALLRKARVQDAHRSTQAP